ncbi:unnamed protein product [Miscanthus lutarioriparius]|uniref:non-specific serine/threonine protein kinase n=1 Tax=Miscanthus lutarioriparius TaxID=422564 RepID=A0A811PLD7_9POAL|nr:unnamed protein product [Miscanthus lutarioriparius]
MAHHDNLVSLWGYCIQGNSRFLIYSYMENGSLDDWLHNRDDDASSFLDWPRRLKIAQGASQGLSYIHNVCKPHIVHRGIKSSNILLDKEFKAYVADFELSRLILPNKTHVTTELVVRHMLAAGHDVHVVTAAPEFGVTTEIASSRLHIRKVEQVVLDCVAVEPDALTVDRSASLEEFFFSFPWNVNTSTNIMTLMQIGLMQDVVPRASILKSEAEWLKSIDANVVVSDVATGMKGSAESVVASLLSDWEEMISQLWACGMMLVEAYGAVPASIRKGLQRTGVRHVDILNIRKDAADKLILVDMFRFAYYNPTPACMLLISGDADFVPAVRVLVERGYTIVIAIPSQGTAASDLTSAGTYMWDWPSLARGEDVTAVGSSEVPASVAEDLFVNTEKDPYVPVEDKDVEAVIVGASSQENEPNERRINKTVFIGKNLNQELEKGFKD